MNEFTVTTVDGGTVAAPEPVLVEGYVWCDCVGGVHEDEPDPYSYGVPCPGEHTPLWRQETQT